MKKIIAAWIEQVLQFDTSEEYSTFLNDLEKKGQKYQVMTHSRKDDSSVRVRIRKQYNNNCFPVGKEVV